MFAGDEDSSTPVPKCPRDTSALVPNCPDTSAPVWWCRNVLGPKWRIVYTDRKQPHTPAGDKPIVYDDYIK